MSKSNQKAAKAVDFVSWLVSQVVLFVLGGYIVAGLILTGAVNGRIAGIAVLCLLTNLIRHEKHHAD